MPAIWAAFPAERNESVLINEILDFVIVARTIFLGIKQINRLKKAPPSADPTTKECPKCCSTIFHQGEPMLALHLGVGGVGQG